MEAYDFAFNSLVILFASVVVMIVLGSILSKVFESPLLLHIFIGFGLIGGFIGTAGTAIARDNQVTEAFEQYYGVQIVEGHIPVEINEPQQVTLFVHYTGRTTDCVISINDDNKYEGYCKDGSFL